MNKQRYIEERKGKKGISYRVKVNGYSKTFSEEDYLDPRLAFKKAVQYRDSILYGDINPYIEKKISVDEVYKEVFDLFPVRIETRRKLDIYYTKYIKVKDKPIKDIKADDILIDLNNMVEITTNDTIQRVFSIWKKIIHTAIYKEYIYKDVTTIIKCPQSQYRAKFKVNKVIDRQILEQMETLARSHIKSLHDRQVYPLLMEFLYLTGMRICEALALTYDDIKKDHIEITKEIGSSKEERLVVRNCKTELSNREIPLTNEMKAIIKELKKIHNYDVLFCDENGNYYNSTAIGDKLHQLGKRNGLDFNLYAIRHLVSTELTLKNVDERTRIEIFGHSNIATTLGYARSNFDLKKDALEKKSSQKFPKNEN